jgi:hypothetical protein
MLCTGLGFSCHLGVLLSLFGLFCLIVVGSFSVPQPGCFPVLIALFFFPCPWLLREACLLFW